MKQKNLPSRKRQNKVSRQPSSVVDALLTGAITKVKTEAEAEIAKVKAQTDEVINKFDLRTKERRRALTDTRAKDRPSAKVSALFLEAIAKQKAKSEAEIAEAIARVKSEAKAKTDIDTNAGTKAQVKKTPAKPKTKSEAKTTRDTAKVKNKAQKKPKTYTNKASTVKPSSKVEALFSNAVAKQKAKSEAEIAEAIAKVKAETEEALAKQQATSETETAEAIARVKAENEEAIAKVKAEPEEKTRTDTDKIAEVKAEAEEATAGQKVKSGTEVEDQSIAKTDATTKVQSEPEEAIAQVKAEAEETTRAHIDTKAEVKTEADEVTGEQKPKAEIDVEEESIADTDSIVKDQSEVEVESNANIDATAKVQPEPEEEPSADTKTTAKVKSEIEEARAEQKRKSEAEACEAIAKVKAEAIEAITKAQAKAEEEAAVYTVTIAKVKTGEKSATIVGSNDQPICETQRTSQSLKLLPDEYFVTDSSSPLFGLLQNANISLSAQDIMQKELVWGSADDSVRQTFKKMQQYNTSYVMVGHGGVLEGIVSKSDITGATSPYIQPAFSRRRQFLDDATLQIRIRWIMSRPVYIISPQTSLEVVMRHMCQFRRLCLPVVDQQSNVLGLVTQDNILQALLQLQSSPGTSTSDQVHRGQPVSGHPLYDSTEQAAITMEASPVYSQ